jgi:hypothetical protein
MDSQIILRTEVNRPRELTKQEAERIDREHPNRKRIPAPAMNDVWALMSMTFWIRDIVENPKMQELFKGMGVLPRLRMATTTLYNCCQKVMSQISAAQLRTIDANLGKRTMTISAYEHVDSFVNIDGEVLDVLMVQTLKGCKESLCMADEKEAANCPVKKALDCCLLMSHLSQKTAPSLGVCPYATLDLGEETA